MTWMTLVCLPSSHGCNHIMTWYGGITGQYVVMNSVWDYNKSVCPYFTLWRISLLDTSTHQFVTQFINLLLYLHLIYARLFNHRLQKSFRHAVKWVGNKRNITNPDNYLTNKTYLGLLSYTRKPKSITMMSIHKLRIDYGRYMRKTIPEPQKKIARNLLVRRSKNHSATKTQRRWRFKIWATYAGNHGLLIIYRLR